MTDELLTAAGNFLETNFFKKSMAGISFAHGPTFVESVAGVGCRFRLSDGTWVNNTALTLVEGVTYEFISFQNATTFTTSDGFGIYSPGFGANRSGIEMTSNNSNIRGVSTLARSTFWRVPSSAIGTSFEYSCLSDTPVGNVTVVVRIVFYWFSLVILIDL